MDNNEVDILISDYLESHVISRKEVNGEWITAEEADKSGEANISSINLISTGEKEDIEKFFLRLCADRTPEQLAYIGAGVVENAAWWAHIPALEALHSAATTSIDVRRAVGFAWFSTESTDQEVNRLIAEVEKLALRDLED